MNILLRVPSIILIWLFLGWASIGSGQGLDYPKYSAHVNDFAGVMDQPTIDQLETILLNFEQRTGTQIAVVTIQSLNERPIEEYANGLYRAWGIGAKSGENKNKGALLLIAVNDRRSRLEVGYGLEGDLPDGLAGEILRRMRPYFQQEQYAEGLTVGTRTLVDTLAQKWNVSLEGIDQRYAYQGPTQSGGEAQTSPLALICIMIFFFLLLMIILRRAGRGGGGRGGGPGILAGPIIFNRGGGGFGGGGSWGGFGGGGGGGGWGGFGGGSSGGGGASGSW